MNGLILYVFICKYIQIIFHYYFQYCLRKKKVKDIIFYKIVLVESFYGLINYDGVKKCYRQKILYDYYGVYYNFRSDAKLIHVDNVTEIR